MKESQQDVASNDMEKEIVSAIYLSEKDAKLFVEFQKRFAFINLLESLRFFDIKDGSAEIHFDKQGQIVKIDIHNHYRV